MDIVTRLLAAVVAVAWTSSHSVEDRIHDYVHEWFPDIIPSEIAHVLCVGLAAFAALQSFRNHTFDHAMSVVTHVYSKAMFIKATLLALTILPDANTACRKELDVLSCLTRNDMLPSGHMMLALSSALILKSRCATKLAYVCGFLLVASRMHYTVDVVLAWWIVHLLENIRNPVATLQ